MNSPSNSTRAELGLKEEDAAKRQDHPPVAALWLHGQPWGIFFVEFENKKLPVVVLRRILSHLVIKKRASANKATAPAWHAEDLLFVTAFGEDSTDNREIAFAHFHQNPGDLPTLHVLGWDGGDTPLKLANVDRVLHERLRWPDDESDTDAWRENWASPSAPARPRHPHCRLAGRGTRRVWRAASATRPSACWLHETERGALTKLYKAFQTALIHDLDAEELRRHLRPDHHLRPAHRRHLAHRNERRPLWHRLSQRMTSPTWSRSPIRF